MKAKPETLHMPDNVLEERVWSLGRHGCRAADPAVRTRSTW